MFGVRHLPDTDTHSSRRVTRATEITSTTNLTNYLHMSWDTSLIRSVTATEMTSITNLTNS